MTTAVTLDLDYQGHRGLISAFLVPAGDGGFVLLDTGPASTLDVLEGDIEAVGYALRDLRAILLTHIHLDHAAAAGTLASRTGCQVWAHPNGLVHLGSPESKLLPSARRLYGNRLEPLFGVMEAVPEDVLHPVVHGEPVQIGELTAVGWHTPGHASHHVAWQVADSVATGDVAGIRLQGSDHVVPPMPPPDIDVELWLDSIDLVRRLDPSHLLLTHFGCWDDPARQLDELASRLRRWSGVAREVMAEGGDVGTLERRLVQLDDADMESAPMTGEARNARRRLCSMAENAAGLYRWAAGKLRVES